MDHQFSGTLLLILKWTIVVFAAGFIGYFGRHLAKSIIARLGKPPSKPGGSAPSPPSPAPLSADIKREKLLAKVEKKRLKLAEKKTRKNPSAPLD